jgi:DNA-binding CsgD family transcriptional regulator
MVKAIADKLTMNADVITTHLYRSYEKLYVDSRMALQRYAQARRWYDPSLLSRWISCSHPTA